MNFALGEPARRGRQYLANDAVIMIALSAHDVAQLLKSDPSVCTPLVALRAVNVLGGLAPGWLHPDVAAKARSATGDETAAWLGGMPKLPAEVGATWVILAQDERPMFPLLRSAFVLPLHWRRGRTHCESLPLKLRVLAQAIATDLGSTEWGIEPNECLGRLSDLNWLDELGAFESAYVSLAGGLIAAIAGRGPDPTIWATGAWRPGAGIREVGRMRQKLELARDYEVTRFFVPSQVANEARQLVDGWRGAGMEVGELDAGNESIRMAIRAYTRALKVPPPDDAPFEELARYYLDDLETEAEYKAWYRLHLMPKIIERCRANLERDYPDLPAPVCYISFADNVDLVTISSMVMRPERALLMFTGDREDQAGETKREIGQRTGGSTNVTLELVKNDDHIGTTVAALVRPFVSGVDPSRVVLDLTPGHKLMTLSLALDAAQAGNTFAYLRHKLRHPKVEPGTERFRLWRKT